MLGVVVRAHQEVCIRIMQGRTERDETSTPHSRSNGMLRVTTNSWNLAPLPGLSLYDRISTSCCILRVLTPSATHPLPPESPV
jgi:hypothetical protein